MIVSLVASVAHFLLLLLISHPFLLFVRFTEMYEELFRFDTGILISIVRLFHLSTSKTACTVAVILSRSDFFFCISVIQNLDPFTVGPRQRSAFFDPPFSVRKGRRSDIGGKEVSSLRQVVTLTGRGQGYLAKGSRYVMYRPCQNWLNLWDLSLSSSFFRPGEKARGRRPPTSLDVINHPGRVIAIISYRQVRHWKSQSRGTHEDFLAESNRYVLKKYYTNV